MLRSLTEKDICQIGSWYTPKFSAVAQETETGVGGQPWVTYKARDSVWKERQAKWNGGRKKRKKREERMPCMIPERSHEHPCLDLNQPYIDYGTQYYVKN